MSRGYAGLLLRSPRPPRLRAPARSRRGPGRSNSASDVVRQGDRAHLVDRGDEVENLLDAALAQGHDAFGERERLDLVLVLAVEHHAADRLGQLQHFENGDAAAVAGLL